MGAYEAFIAAKRHSSSEHGFDPIFMPECAFDFQREIISRAVRKGRVGVFADTGLGKTLIEIAIADDLHEMIEAGHVLSFNPPGSVDYRSRMYSLTKAGVARAKRMKEMSE